MINFEDVKLLKLEPGQTLVVQVDGYISSEQRFYIKEMFETNVPMSKGRLLIIGTGISLSVIDASS